MTPKVETRSGWIRGGDAAGIRVFRGVRYARAPEGKLRFLPPVAPEPWTGTFDATRPGPAAPQLALPWFGWISAAGVPPGEDCLSLNVWTPGLDDARRPVLVWMHGGGFMVGSGATPVYDGHDLARRGDVVVVTINYRLGALGYVHLKSVLGDDFGQSSNLGVRDQIAALEWVSEHIERFGGDPNNVTLVGQSAGAMSIGALLGSPRAHGLFHRAICQSGAADHVLEPEDAELIAGHFLSALGGPAPTLEALGGIPIRQILKAQRETMQRLSDLRRLMVFLPTVDGDVIPEQPLAAVRRGAIAHVPLMVGTTQDEWKLFRVIDPGVLGLGELDLVERFAEVLSGHDCAPDPEAAVRDYRAALRAREADTSPTNVWSAFQSARVMHVPAVRLADAHTASGGSAHSYLFTWHPPGPLGRIGACHGLDIPFVFGSTQHPFALPFTGLTGSATRLSRKMQHAWIHFAREGRPQQDQLPAWPAYESPRRATMLLGRSCVLAEGPLDQERNMVAQWMAPPAEAVSPAVASR